MRLEILLQFILPLTFLAIWALTSLLNRDTQPLPPRPGRAPGPAGPRPGMGAAAAAASRGDASGALRSASTARSAAPPAQRGAAPPRWVPTSASPSARPGGAARGGGHDEGITIIEAENRSTPAFSPSSSATARSARSTPARRAPAARGRSTQTQNAPLKSIEPDRPRALTGLVSQPLVTKKSRSLEITPLSTPISPIGSPMTQLSQGTTLELPHATSTTTHPTLTSIGLRAMLASPAKLREIALLGEILQPPMALRPRRRPH